MSYTQKAYGSPPRPPTADLPTRAHAPTAATAVLPQASLGCDSRHTWLGPEAHLIRFQSHQALSCPLLRQNWVLIQAEGGLEWGYGC